MLAFILTITLTVTLLIIYPATKPALKRLLLIPPRHRLDHISSHMDNNRCPTPRQCIHLLANITPSSFYRDTLARFYDPRYEPSFSDPRILHPDHEAGTADAAPPDGESTPASPISSSCLDIKAERAPGIAYEDYLTFLDSSASGSGMCRRENEARAFARYKKRYHEYLHDLAMARGMSIERAWEEIESRRWRWGLEEKRVRKDEYRERRGAIHIV